MINLTKLVLKILPWLLTVGLLGWMLFEEKMSFSTERRTEIVTSTVLTRVEQMGKMELVKYNFQEVTEVKKIAKEISLGIQKFKLVPDSKGVLISQGSAVGCIDFTKISQGHVSATADTIFVRLPSPEICYFKIDLENRSIRFGIGHSGTDQGKCAYGVEANVGEHFRAGCHFIV